MRLPLIGLLALATASYSWSQDRLQAGKYEDPATGDYCIVHDSGQPFEGLMEKPQRKSAQHQSITCYFDVDGRKHYTTTYGGRLIAFSEFTVEGIKYFAVVRDDEYNRYPHLDWHMPESDKRVGEEKGKHDNFWQAVKAHTPK